MIVMKRRCLSTSKPFGVFTNQTKLAILVSEDFLRENKKKKTQQNVTSS